MTNKNYVFENIDDLIGYLYTKVKYFSPIKVQKGLYFLYAFYSGYYRYKDADTDAYNENFLNELFPATFEAWDYGPVIRSVFIDRKYNEEKFKKIAEEKFYGDKAINFFNTLENGIEIQNFIDDVFSQILNTSDFGLVDRRHYDEAWLKAYRSNKEPKIIQNKDIIDEYKDKFKHEM